MDKKPFLLFPLLRDDGARDLDARTLNYKNTFMEQINRIEIRGYVGSVSYYNNTDRPMARMTVATSYAYKDREGGAVIETTWFSVIAWEGKGIAPLSKIAKGSKVQVTGRIRNQKFTGSDGQERTSSEVYANKLSIIEGDEPFQYEV